MPKRLILNRLTSKNLTALIGSAAVLFSLMAIVQIGMAGLPSLKLDVVKTVQIILFSGLIGLNIMASFRFKANQPKVLTANLLMIALFVLLGSANFLNADEAIKSFEAQSDVAFNVLWLIGGLALMFQINNRKTNKVASILIYVGLALQVGMFFNSISSLFRQAADPVFAELVESSSETLIVTIYIFAMLISLVFNRFEKTGEVQPNTTQGKGFRHWLTDVMFVVGYSKIGSMLAIGYTNIQHLGWKLLNPNGTFADFYAWQITKKLDKGRAHRTLGAKQFEQDIIIGQAPVHTKQTLVQRRPNEITDHVIEIGLKPHHTLVDFGCGSLRVGQPLIEWLDPNKYWGMDVTDRFFNDGLTLLDKDVLANKNPQLRVINQQSLLEVKQAKPDFIMSIAVLKHVPLNELDGYFDKLCGMMHEQTILSLTFSASETEKRIAGKSWSWSKQRITKLMQDRLPNHKVEITMSRYHTNQNNVALEFCFITARPK